MDAVLAVDVGGSSVKAEVQTPDGSALAAARRAITGRGEAAVATVVETAQAALDEAPGTARVVGSGVAVPGLVDSERGVSELSVNLGWRDVPLASLLTQSLGVPVRLGHDVFAAGRAEVERGAAQGVDSAVVVVIGTGISAVLIAGGRVIRGGLGQAGEFGHLLVRPDGPSCECGRRGCLEAVASAAAIARQYADRTGSPAVSGAAVVAQGVEEGDEVATLIWQEAAAALADGLLSVTTLLAPSVVVIDGGLAESGATLLDPLRDQLRSRVTFERVPDLRLGRFGARAGVVGAGLLAQGIGEGG